MLRYHKASGTKRPRAFNQAISRRAEFDRVAARFPVDAKGREIMPWCVGNEVLCRGQPGIIQAFASGVSSTKEGYASAGGCTIAFEVDGETTCLEYESLGNDKGGARLQRCPPSLRPPQHRNDKFVIPEDVKQRVNDTYHAECCLSPHVSDMKRKRIAPHIYVKAQALVIMSDLRAIFDAHIRRYPSDVGRLSFSTFKGLKPWYAIKGGRETCLCKWCENFLCYQDALRLAVSYLQPLLPATGEDEGAREVVSEEEDAGDSPSVSDTPSESPLAKLVRICQLKSKQAIVNEFVCGGSIQTAKHTCVSGLCSQCGFDKLWSARLRKDIVDAYGKPRAGVDKIWLTHIKWERMKSGNVQGNTELPVQGTPDKEVLRQRCNGTIIDLLDEFETRVMAKYPFHRQTLLNQKECR